MSSLEKCPLTLQSNGMKSRDILQQTGLWRAARVSGAHIPHAHVHAHPSEQEVLGEEHELLLQDQGPSPVLELGAEVRAVGWDAARPLPSSCCPLTDP